MSGRPWPPRPTELMHSLWREQRARGAKPTPVFAVLSDGGPRPKGYCVDWSIKKAAAHRSADRFGFPCSVVKITPPNRRMTGTLRRIETMTTTKQLTERRKADRKAMADQLQALALAHGATVERTERDRRILLEIQAARGLSVNIDVDGDSCQPDVHVIPWYIRCGSDALLSRSFGDVNPHHFGKATHVRIGFEALRDELARGLAAAADGSAFGGADLHAEVERQRAAYQARARASRLAREASEGGAA